ncbi:MAG: hypothetical protein ACRD29_11270 [Acidimicrobiales bacterium]
MSANREPGGLFGVLGVGVAVCCGLPLLFGAGVAVGAAGVALGSAVVIAAGVGLGVLGWRRRRHRSCGTPDAGVDGAATQTDRGKFRAASPGLRDQR